MLWQLLVMKWVRVIVRVKLRVSVNDSVRIRDLSRSRCYFLIVLFYGASAWSLSSEIGARLSRKTGDPRATAFLRQNIDVAIQPGNAASIWAPFIDASATFLTVFIIVDLCVRHYYFAIRIFFRLLTFIGLHNVYIKAIVDRFIIIVIKLL